MEVDALLTTYVAFSDALASRSEQVRTKSDQGNKFPPAPLLATVIRPCVQGPCEDGGSDGGHSHNCQPLTAAFLPERLPSSSSPQFQFQSRGNGQVVQQATSGNSSSIIS